MREGSTAAWVCLCLSYSIDFNTGVLLGWEAMEEPKSHTDGSEHALAHGNAVRLETHWPWKGSWRYNISSPIYHLGN